MSESAAQLPRLVVGAPASGSGKTTIATGLMAAFRARGLQVAGFKVGPDFIDPSYHALATGRPGRNLDVFLSGPEWIAPLLRHGAAGSDLALVEGVMGLFDGIAGDRDEGSTADVARLLGAPVVLVLDAAAMARSAAAIVHGFAGFDPGLRLAGVILNRVGSSGHAQLLREALDPLGIPIVGVAHESDSVVAPERHLGLVPASEAPASAREFVAAARALVERSCDLEALLALARRAAPLTEAPWSPSAAVTDAAAKAATVAVAGGPAFSFQYEENLELLAAAGATVIRFDPLSDTSLPVETDALYLGGGFPELFVAELSQNVPLRESVAALAREGRPVLAECGGLLYLLEELDGRPLCGVLPAVGRWAPRLTIGYREAGACAASALLPAGGTIRGHEFHRTETVPAHGRQPAWRLEAAGGERLDGFLSGGVHASYLHTHWAATPQMAARFVAAAARGAVAGPEAVPLPAPEREPRARLAP